MLIRLDGVPARLFWAAEEQWTAMLREYDLRGMGGTVQSYGGHEITRAGSCLGLVADALRAQPPGQGVCSVELHLTQPGDFALLQGILDECRLLSRAGELLVLPSLEEVVAFRDWLCGEVAEQAVGGAPSTWHLKTADSTPWDTEAPIWDPGLTPGDDVAWLVGDDHNRLVAASPAALELLGWQAAELIGQRLLVVIPPHLREAHIAAFTRSVVSGVSPLLGQPLALPALTRDGREIPIMLTLTRHDARAGRHVYLARIEPA